MKSPDVDATLAALADPTRRQVIELLKQRPRPAGELAAAVDMSGPAMSRHLRVLRRCNLVEEERDAADARLRIYRLRREPFSGLQVWLEGVQTFWEDQLGSFKTHAERKARGAKDG